MNNEVKPTAAEVGAAIQKWGREDPRTVQITRERVLALQAAELDMPKQWWWLSFANEERFLGLVLVRESGYMLAVSRTHALGINPGGEIAGWPLPEEAGDPPERYREVLLDKTTADHLSEFGWGS